MAAQTPQMGVFFSPPEYRSDSFSSSSPQNKYTEAPAATTSMHSSNKLPPISSIFTPYSPPVSPHALTDKEMARSGSFGSVRDPLLFQDKRYSPAADSLSPLFVSPEKTVDEAIDEHIATQARSKPRASIPSRSDYQLVASIRPKIVDRYNANPALYIRQEMEHLRAYPPRFPQPTQSIGAKRAITQASSPAKRQRVSKITTSTITKLPRAKRLPRSSPREAVEGTFETTHVPYTPAPKAVSVAPHRDDFNFDKLDDYSPPLATLANGGKALKAEWRGHPLDLSNDPDKHMLHDAEIGLASTLRLSCAQYLTSKRRIFAARLESLRNGREFRKTTAQQACNIDVNKASKLWTAFDKVGWFNPGYMARFI